MDDVADSRAFTTSLHGKVGCMWSTIEDLRDNKPCHHRCPAGCRLADEFDIGIFVPSAKPFAKVFGAFKGKPSRQPEYNEIFGSEKL